MYEIAVPVIGHVIYQVIAESEADAKAKVVKGNWVNVEYDVTRDMIQETWIVERNSP